MRLSLILRTCVMALLMVAPSARGQILRPIAEGVLAVPLNQWRGIKYEPGLGFDVGIRLTPNDQLALRAEFVFVAHPIEANTYYTKLGIAALEYSLSGDARPFILLGAGVGHVTLDCGMSIYPCTVSRTESRGAAVSFGLGARPRTFPLLFQTRYYLLSDGIQSLQLMVGY